MIIAFKNGNSFVSYKGSEHQIKEFKGYLFAADDLFTALTDKDGEFLDSEAEDIDNGIAFFFDNEEFAESTDEQLYDLFNQHS